jgi:hypothetical protein
MQLLQNLKHYKNKNVKYGKALKEIASNHLKNKAEIRSAMFKKNISVDLLAKKIINELHRINNHSA